MKTEERMNIRICTDSGSGLTFKEAETLGIDYLPLQVSIEEKTYLDGIYLTNEQLYKEIQNGAFPKTSQPPLGYVKELFDTYDHNHVSDVILITLSNALSNTNATISALAKEYHFTLHTLDIMSTLSLQKHIAIQAKRLVDKGVHCQDIISELQTFVNASNGYLVTDNLEHLAKGGRLSPTAAKLGGMLQIKPILTISAQTKGTIEVAQKVRTLSKALKNMCMRIYEEIGGNDKEYIISIMYTDKNEHIDFIQNMLQQLLPNAQFQQEPICAVLACHTGLGSIAIQYFKKGQQE